MSKLNHPDGRSENSFEYKDREEKVLASIMQRLKRQFNGKIPNVNLRRNQEIVKHKVMAEMYILQKVLAKFGEEGVVTAKKEMSQMHHCVCFKAITISQLTQQECCRAMEGVMFLSRKNQGTSKVVLPITANQHVSGSIKTTIVHRLYTPKIYYCWQV